ncbi:hypothetical protein F8388_023665, partial [Cannabis sativa]
NILSLSVTHWTGASLSYPRIELLLATKIGAKRSKMPRGFDRRSGQLDIEDRWRSTIVQNITFTLIGAIFALAGLEEFITDKSKCQEHFDVYKECKKKERKAQLERNKTRSFFS